MIRYITSDFDRLKPTDFGLIESNSIIVLLKYKLNPLMEFLLTDFDNINLEGIFL